MSLPWLHDVEARLTQSFRSERFHHAQLFSGPVGVGKFYLAQQVADALLCKTVTQNPRQLNTSMQACGQCKTCALTRAGTHPDKCIVQVSGQSIGVDEIRNISDFMQHSAAQNGNKVAVIENADKMTTASANALLKTLEEPSAHRYLILTTSQAAQLPATVLSRCTTTDIYINDIKSTENWLASLAIPISPWLSLFYTQPLLIAQWQKNGQLDDINKLYILANEFNQVHIFDDLIAIINKQPDLIQVFILFLTANLKQQLASGMDFDAYQRAQQALNAFSRQTKQVLGLNLALAVAKLAYCLR